MAEPNIITTLRRKRDELEIVLRSYEAKIEVSRLDLAHIEATLRMFELGDDFRISPSPMSLSRFFRYREISTLCLKALEAAPDGLDTRELALVVIHAKGMDETDALMRRAVARHVAFAVKGQQKRGRIANLGKRRRVCVWRLANATHEKHNAVD